jgi:hypothetical protein
LPPYNKLNMHLSILGTAAVSLLASLSSASPTQSDNQLPFLATDNSVTPSASSPVYKNNNATYGPVPKEEQLSSVEYLEIAPSSF